MRYDDESVIAGLILAALVLVLTVGWTVSNVAGCVQATRIAEIQAKLCMEKTP